MNEILDPIKIIDEYIGKTDIMHKETYPTKEASTIEKRQRYFQKCLSKCGLTYLVSPEWQRN